MCDARQWDSAYLLDRQGDVFQYAVLHFELIHHCWQQQLVS